VLSCGDGVVFLRLNVLFQSTVLMGLTLSSPLSIVEPGREGPFKCVVMGFPLQLLSVIGNEQKRKIDSNTRTMHAVGRVQNYMTLLLGSFLKYCKSFSIGSKYFMTNTQT